MRRSWVSGVVAGLLVLAPVAAVAQSGLGDDPEETEEVGLVTERSDVEVDTLELVAETGTDDVDEGGDPPGEETGDAGQTEGHGERVSTVAKCAPTGKLAIDGFRNHGAFVRAAAKGETVTVEGIEYDLSSEDGVAALCAWAETYEPAPRDRGDTAVEPSSGAGTDEGDGARGRPAHAGAPDHAGAPGDAARSSAAGGSDHAGGPNVAGEPDHAGGPSETGPPAHAGPNGEAKGHGKGQAKGRNGR